LRKQLRNSFHGIFEAYNALRLRADAALAPKIGLWYISNQGAISSAAEHLVYTERVDGSIPSSPTNLIYEKNDKKSKRKSKIPFKNRQ
jgi:hypothetical protein